MSNRAWLQFEHPLVSLGLNLTFLNSACMEMKQKNIMIMSYSKDSRGYSSRWVMKLSKYKAVSNESRDFWKNVTIPVDWGLKVGAAG